MRAEHAAHVDAQRLQSDRRVGAEADGDARNQDDRTTFTATRALAGTPRWKLATSDVTDGRYTVYACAMGMTLDDTSAPALARIFARLGGDNMVGHAKSTFAVRRPYLNQPGDICEAKTDHLAGNGDYPSGHTSNGWLTALILAELLPDRATVTLTKVAGADLAQWLGPWAGSMGRAHVPGPWFQAHGTGFIGRVHWPGPMGRGRARARALKSQNLGPGPSFRARALNFQLGPVPF